MIRRAENKDIPRLTELLYQVQAVHAEKRPDIFKIGAKKYTEEELADIIADDCRPIFVLEEDGLIQGYAFCIYHVTQENAQVHYRKTLFIDDLCVDASCRRRGVGTRLYEYVLSAARANGCHSVTLNVWSANEGARSFYRSLGLEPLKTTMEAAFS